MPVAGKDKSASQGRFRMEENVVTKLLREAKKKEESVLIATDVARVVASLAAKDENWA